MAVDPGPRPVGVREREELVDHRPHQPLEGLVVDADEEAEEPLLVALGERRRRLLERLRRGVDGADLDEAGVGRRLREPGRPARSRAPPRRRTNSFSTAVMSHGACSVGLAMATAMRPPGRSTRRASTSTPA